tara:strand:- start:566 stop:1096 length:531 start_codon:yes stop_codon:yes gene_type:complete
MSARLIAAFILVTVFMSFMFIAPAYAVDTVTSATVSSSTVIDKAPPTASSPSIVVNNSDICQVGSSAALQTGLFGVSGGTTTRDLNCERIKLARAVYGMGLKVAGISLLCQDKRVWDALWQAGTPCPWQGAIGEAAKEKWLENPSQSPEGSMIRVDEAAAAEVAATEYPEDEEMYE